MNTTASEQLQVTAQAIYGWSLLCGRCTRTIEDGETALIIESEQGGYVGAICSDCSPWEVQS